MPPSITKVYKQIRIGVLCAYKLPDIDQGLLGGKYTLNPYFKTEWAGKTLKTSVKNKTKEDDIMEWNEMF